MTSNQVSSSSAAETNASDVDAPWITSSPAGAVRQGPAGSSPRSLAGSSLQRARGPRHYLAFPCVVDRGKRASDRPSSKKRPTTSMSLRATSMTESETARSASGPRVHGSRVLAGSVNAEIERTNTGRRRPISERALAASRHRRERPSRCGMLTSAVEAPAPRGGCEKLRASRQLFPVRGAARSRPPRRSIAALVA